MAKSASNGISGHLKKVRDHLLSIDFDFDSTREIRDYFGQRFVKRLLAGQTAFSNAHLTFASADMKFDRPETRPRRHALVDL